MKKILFLLSAFFFLDVSGQDPFDDYKKSKEKMLLDSLKTWKKFNMTIDSSRSSNQKIKSIATFQPMAKLIFTQPNGTKVYSLPQDNMICFVPDLSQYNYNMPNPPKKNVTGMPPGSAPPYKIIPENKR